LLDSSYRSSLSPSSFGGESRLKSGLESESAVRRISSHSFFFRIDDHYAIAIPETRIVNPYGQADWEAIGIQPDIKVPAAEALKTASQRAVSQIQEPGIYLYLQHR